MILVYISIGVLLISIVLLIVAVLSFRKSIEPTFSFFSTVAERMQHESEAIKLQTELMKDKQEQIKNDMDWKKAVFSHTIEQIKRLPDTFKSSKKQKMNSYSREM